MKKWVKALLIVMACILAFVLIIVASAFAITNKAANAPEYKLGDDTIASIVAIVGKRDVNSVSTNTQNDVTTKTIKCKSATVQNDLMDYTQYLRNEAGFILTADMDLTVVPSSVQLAKQSTETGKIIVMTIDYDAFGYTITIQKGVGTLTTN